ncbi:MAG: gliding motility-associated C-terminal domain-containing protein [Bacteroidota bacterium]|nr:gliding motility-associated C-terminal domain-containing protein [Bacteroidota bacterium]
MDKIVRKILISFAAFFFIPGAGMVHGQAAYVNTQEGIYQISTGGGNCSQALITNGCGTDNNILSIAVYKDTIYYNTWTGELKRFKIGFPGSCETLLQGGPAYNGLTVDKNGIVYMTYQHLVRYDPYKHELSDLGTMPYVSAGDVMFFEDKLLMAGYDPYDWSTGIFEININDLSASKLYMSTPDFIGLLSYPTPCGSSRYFGLTCYNTGTTQLTELDLANKTIIGDACSIPLDILDAASITETGLDDKVTITDLQITKSCQSATGSVQINAVFPGAGTISYTLDNATTNTTGSFTGISAGSHKISAAAPGGTCMNDTAFTIAAPYKLVTSIEITNPDYCLNTPATVLIHASSVNAPVTFTLSNSGLSRTSGDFTGLHGGTYDFHIADAGGCMKDTTINIVENIPAGGCNDIFIPNAFTPNNDGKNDFFTIALPSSFKDISLQVFNRWGAAVCQATGNNLSWDGSYKGVQQPIGVYIYSLNYSDRNGNRKILKGTLTLIR